MGGSLKKGTGKDALNRGTKVQSMGMENSTASSGN